MYGDHWDNFMDSLNRESNIPISTLSWHDFLNSLEPESNHQSNTLLQRLASIENTPDIYWYPGSSNDLTPLLLDVPNSPLQRRLFRMNGESEEPPLLLWMSTNYDGLEFFPDYSQLGKPLKLHFDEIWKEYRGTATLGRRKERYKLPGNGKLTLFTAIIKNQWQGIHDREEEGDEYLVCFSPCDSLFLLKKIFSKYNFHLFFVALISQDGFALHKEGFNQYKLPDYIKCINGVGPVDFWAIDIYGQREDHPGEYIGGPINWGWPPSRLFGRPGVSYLREPRPYRIGSNWSKIVWDIDYSDPTRAYFEELSYSEWLYTKHKATVRAKRNVPKTKAELIALEIDEIFANRLIKRVRGSGL
ncbi:hypothetical protein [Crenothrix sp.]|uniref:hypothetical protein n=1 Tax=Crenothrix sp. TaxID=3100433 RepID=UPI00374CA3EC